MTYSAIDNKAINTIRVLAVSKNEVDYGQMDPLSTIWKIEAGTSGLKELYNQLNARKILSLFDETTN
jgi:hypothetical protein